MGSAASLLGGFQSCWYFPGSVPTLTEANVAITGLGWHRRSSKGAVRTDHQSIMEDIHFELKLTFLFIQIFNNLHFQDPVWVWYKHWEHWQGVWVWNVRQLFGMAEKVFAWSSPMCFPALPAGMAVPTREPFYFSQKQILI